VSPLTMAQVVLINRTAYRVPIDTFRPSDATPDRCNVQEDCTWRTPRSRVQLPHPTRLWKFDTIHQFISSGTPLIRRISSSSFRLWFWNTTIHYQTRFNPGHFHLAFHQYTLATYSGHCEFHKYTRMSTLSSDQTSLRDYSRGI